MDVDAFLDVPTARTALSFRSADLGAPFQELYLSPGRLSDLPDAETPLSFRSSGEAELDDTIVGANPAHVVMDVTMAGDGRTTVKPVARTPAVAAEEEATCSARATEAARASAEEEARIACAIEAARASAEEEARIACAIEAARASAEEEARFAREAEAARVSAEEEARFAREAEAARASAEEQANSRATIMAATLASESNIEHNTQGRQKENPIIEAQSQNAAGAVSATAHGTQCHQNSDSQEAFFEYHGDSSAKVEGIPFSDWAEIPEIQTPTTFRSDPHADEAYTAEIEGIRTDFPDLAEIPDTETPTTFRSDVHAEEGHQPWPSGASSSIGPQDVWDIFSDAHTKKPSSLQSSVGSVIEAGITQEDGQPQENAPSSTKLAAAADDLDEDLNWLEAEAASRKHIQDTVAHHPWLGIRPSCGELPLHAPYPLLPSTFGVLQVIPWRVRVPRPMPRARISSIWQCPHRLMRLNSLSLSSTSMRLCHNLFVTIRP
jgi:hypothetical protein